MGFHAVFGREPPTRMSVYKWYEFSDQAVGDGEPLKLR
jgi:hypothetical protein